MFVAIPAAMFVIILSDEKPEHYHLTIEEVHSWVIVLLMLILI